MQTSLVKKCVAELIGTFALIFVGLGAIYHLGAVPGGLLGIALPANNWKDAVVYFVGPLLGSGLAGLIYGRFLIKP